MATLATNPVHARPAQFDRATQHRRAMLAKINIGRHQLRMVEDDYRQLLLATTGKISLRECSDGQLERMIDALKAKGFKPLPKGGRAAATHPVARKARALWISLHQLGVVNNPSEQALEAFARRQLKCERFAWARQSEGHRIIEALKSMAARAGWPQHDPVRQKPLDPLTLQSSLCEVILAKLKDAGVVPPVWNLNQAAFRLHGIELGAAGPVTADQYQVLAAALGANLRDVLPAGGVQ